MTRCPVCGSTRIFRFKASPRIRSDAKPTLPEVCRGCGLVTVGGLHLPLPADLQAATRKLAIAASEAGKEAREQIMADPDLRVEKYFGRVYESAYLDGFIRAMAFFQHRYRQGRFFRMRELWNKGFDIEHEKNTGTPEVILIADKAAYTEFEQLLQPTLDSGGRHGPSSENQHPSRQKRSSSMP